ncbi:MAG TPA: DNA-3-methyladenine glycosylase [Jeotgalicoccus aerolatus]|nr:DNA-3-methyladenine glycosylase 2 family protein [Jeotgalicoccus aerolatus]HJG33739.1 DNA-3-methyladenine glycosylase [Jeotgalicoccus aerolatus]
MQWTEHNQSIDIELPDIFNFKNNLDYLQRDPNECMYEVIENTVIKLIHIGDLQVLVQLSVNNEDCLTVHFLRGTAPKSAADKAAVVQYICEWFDLDRDIRPFYNMASQDDLLKDAVKKVQGLRLIGIPDLFEALCWAVLGQQINLKFAYSLKRQFAEKYGESITYNDKKYWSFPSCETIAELNAEDMSDIKMTARKSEYIIGLAKLMTTGELSKDKLLKMSDFKRAEKELTHIRGIGPWTANYVLMRCLRFPAAFPIDDIGLINSIKYQLNMDRKPTKQEILNYTAGWKGWESYATFYMWRLRY